jgi:glycerophosphoryl diester phosphodiesterase
LLEPRPVTAAILRDLRAYWKPLVVTDLACKLLGLAVLTPLVGVLLRVLMAISGRPVLADQDILFFLLGPAGWSCAVAIAAVSIGIVATEQAALMLIIAAQHRHFHGCIDVLRLSAAKSPRVVAVAGRMAIVSLLAVAPFAVGVGITYFTLLSEYDINYYLQVRPPAFWLALGIGALLAAVFVGIWLRLLTGWLFALPLIVFENVPADRALRASGERARGFRWALMAWIARWIAASMAASAIVTTLIVAIGRLLVPLAAGSLTWTTVAIGLALVVWTLVHLAVSLLSTTLFAAMLLNLYRLRSGGKYIESLGRGAAADDSLTRISGRWIAAGVAGTVAVAVFVGALAVLGIQLDDRCRIVAHRGASLAAPENTLSSIRQAITDGADAVEIDVQETADGEIVVMHDRDFMKQAGNELKIWDATLADLADLDIGTWFAADFKDERIATLGQVLDECRGKCRVVIELKYYGHQQQLEQRVAQIIDDRHMASDVVVMSLEAAGVEKMKSLRPNFQVGLVLSVAAGDLTKIDIDFLAVNARFADRRLINACHRLDREVYVWTVNDAATMSTMISRGVDYLITDDPVLARTVLAERANMTVPQRLLANLAEWFGLKPKIGES